MVIEKKKKIGQIFNVINNYNPKFKSIVRKFNCNQNKCYSHSAYYVIVDEKLEAFPGRCSFIQ